MIKITLLAITALIFSACANKHGISLQPYDDCKEYYDFQGYYHKDCGSKDIVSYKEIGESTGKAYDKVHDKAVEIVTGKEKKKEEEKPQPNVW